MTRPTLLFRFIPAALALGCSGSDPVATELRPEFATSAACTQLPTVNSVPASVTKAPNSAGSAVFSVHNNCASGTSGFWDFSASRTGQVISAGPPSPQFATIAGGANGQISVPYNTGSAGIGSVKLSATSDAPFGTTTGTQAVTVSGGALGIPFGPIEFFTSTSQTETIGTQWFNLASDGITAPYIIARINAARSKGLKLVTHMTGGSHDQYMSTINGVFQFDMARWKAKMETYRDPAIQESVRKAVLDGIIIGNSVMDEPNVSGTPEGGGNTWGPAGTMNKARVDTMCTYARGIFPTLPLGVALRHDRLEPTKNFTSCEFIMDQWVAATGTAAAFRDAALAFANRHPGGFKILFSMNIVDGGTQDTDGTWDCAGTGGRGGRTPNCRMTATQIRTVGQTLGVAGCAMTMWKYDNTANYMSNTANQQAFQDVRTLLNSKPAKSCKKQ